MKQLEGKITAVTGSGRGIGNEYKGLDILVANAGGQADTAYVEQSDPDLWKEIIDSNLISSYLSIQAAIPLLKRNRGGKVITLGSGMGHRGVAGNSAYGDVSRNSTDSRPYGTEL